MNRAGCFSAANDLAILLQAALNLDARTHCRGYGDSLDVYTLQAAWFLGVQAGEECTGVLAAKIGRASCRERV